MSRFASLCVLLLGLVVSAGAGAEIYKNEQYQFEVEVPGGLTVCRDEPPAPNHGFAVPVGSKECADSFIDESVDYVSFFVSYNVAHEVRTSRELGKYRCHGTRMRDSDVVVDRLRFVRCGPMKRDRRSEVVYFALRPTENPGYANWFVIEASLYCQPSKLRLCEKTLLDLLRRMRLTN